MTTRCMIDLETLGTSPGCTILSIGAVTFDADGLGERFHRSISLESNEAAGLTIDADTLAWWLDQDADAREVLSGGEELGEVLHHLRLFFQHQDIEEVWAHSPSFDCAILKAAYEAVGQDAPWGYYDERDARTLAELPCAVDVAHEGTEHDALDDAVRQAKMVRQTLARLEGVEA